MILGVDLDNTLICYDDLFHDAGVRNGILPPDGPRNKRSVRAWLVERGRENDFTLLQAEVYGVGIRQAKPYRGALTCVREFKHRGVPVYIVSHKTRHPAAGPRHDLRRAASEWLCTHRFAADDLLSENEIFFTDTLDEKVAIVNRLGCTHFIDDLLSFLARLPEATKKIWFTPEGNTAAVNSSIPELVHSATWGEIARYFF